MTPIPPRQLICAIRGGPESRATVSHAIQLALDTGVRLTFFHIMDAEFLQHATIGPLSVVYNELVEMGQFTMQVLVDRAQRRGVVDVDYVVKEGNIHRQLREMAIQTQAEVVVMGRPTRSPGSNVFKMNELEAFVAEMEREGGVRVILADQPAR